MRHFIFGHQYTNESLAKRRPLFYNTDDTPHHKPLPPIFHTPLFYNTDDIPHPLLHTSKIIACDFPSI